MSTQTPDRANTLGIVGVGVMGGGIAANLLKGGANLVVYDVNPARVQHFASLGAYAASSPADVARQASTLISMVETTAQSEDVIMGADGFQSAAQPGDVILFRMRDGAVAKHLGICTRAGRDARFVHAYSGHGVVESALSLPWRRRIVARFAFPEEG